MRQNRWIFGLVAGSCAVFAVATYAGFLSPTSPIPDPGTFGGPRRQLTASEATRFQRGRFLFDREFGLSHGLGPEFNGDSCRACHLDPAIGGAGGLDVNVFRFGRDGAGTLPFMEVPGGQIASKLRRQDLVGREEVPSQADVFEQRQPPALFGIGLIEGIPAANIFANEDPGDLNGDGVRGVARRVTVGGVEEVGKYGWKAQVPRIVDFVRDAMGAELGMTTPDDARGFAALTDTDPNSDPELGEVDVQDLGFFLEMLAPPPRGGGADSPLVQLGALIFEQVGCVKCHTPALMGAEGPVPLFSDLLLHRVMPNTFRGMAEPGADVGFYRTPPLWGVSRTAPYLHDGRAETLSAAILAHDGEATLVREAYQALSGSERQALEVFLKDL